MASLTPMLVFCLFLGSGFAQKLNYNKVVVEQAGQSGKVKLYVEGDKDNKIFAIMDSMYEVDAGGNPVGVGGRYKHSFDSFATQSFQWGDVKSGVVPYSDVRARYFTFDCQLKGLSSNVETAFYLVTKAGNITLDEELQEMHKGQVKFSIRLSNWNWCGCEKDGRSENGRYVDLNIAFETENGRMPIAFQRDNSDGSAQYMFGNKGKIILSREVDVDGEWMKMANGYPKFSTVGDRQVFTFRFPRFGTYAFYDPVINLLDDYDDDDDDDSASSKSSASSDSSSGYSGGSPVRRAGSDAGRVTSSFAVMIFLLVAAVRLI